MHGRSPYGGLACRPSGDQGVPQCSGFGLLHGRPPVPSPPALLLLHSSSLLAADREIPMGGGAVQGDADWGGRLYRAAPRVSRAREWAAGMRHRGHAVAIRGCQRCRGRRPWGRRGCLRRLPCPHGVVTGKTAGGKGESGGKKGLTGGPHMAAREEERWVIAGPAGCVGPQG
jgi:hypothetical protein